MRCQLVRVDGFGWVFMCGGTCSPLCACGRQAGYQCDGPQPNGKTCDKPLCDRHRHRLGRRDFCPACWPTARRRPGAQLELFE
jgi:hypothetical protein